MGEMGERLGGDEGALGKVHGVERRAVGAHETGDGRTDHRRAQLLLKGAEHGVV